MASLQASNEAIMKEAREERERILKEARDIEKQDKNQPSQSKFRFASVLSAAETKPCYRLIHSFRS